MKKFTFIFAALALLASAALTSCQKDPAPSVDEGTKSIALSINFGGVATKAVDDELEPGFGAGDDYESFQIYFTNDDGDIKYAYNATSSDAGEDTPAGEIWDNLVDAASNGVKFIGLDAVSGVYVTANGELAPETITYGGAVAENVNVNVSAINELLKIENIDATEANAMPYAGACIQLQPLGSTQISADAGEVVVGDGAEGAEYWKAELSIRPVVSRFEVSKVGVKTSGTTYFKEVDNEGVKVLEPCDDTDPGVKYKVEWTGFDADLIGIYMSNFYKSSPLFPNKTVIDDWTAELFSTPGFNEGVSPIAEGKWTGLSDDQNDGISYANYNNGYQDFTTAHVGTTSGTTNYLFYGGSDASAVVVPFNFFVPYSLSDRSANADDVVDFGAACPALHFQFKKPVNPTFSCTSVQYYTSGSWQNVTDTNLEQQLQNAVAWPNSTDGIAYANVTKFLNDDQQTELTVKPGLIYKVQEVVVEPVNLSVSTKDTDQFNVYVVVQVVGFDVENVFPVFD